MITIYTDGACSGNPGPGGWAAIISRPEQLPVEIAGGVLSTTNNRMELQSVINALKTLTDQDQTTIEVHTDSAYVCNGISQKWFVRWEANGWKTSANKPVLNQDLWKELLTLIQSHKVEFKKVKGHADNALNNRCDHLAVCAVPR